MVFARTTKTVGRFIRDRDGIAATEFALILPLLTILFFGVVEGSDALAQSRRVSLAVNTLADLAAQETELLTSDVDSLFTGVEEIAETNGAAITVRLVSVIANPDGDPMVHWSRDNSGAQPYAPGADYTHLSNNALLDADASLIVAEIEYEYNSKLTKMVIKDVNFGEVATRWPRRAAHVELCTAPNTCTDASTVAPA